MTRICNSMKNCFYSEYLSLPDLCLATQISHQNQRGYLHEYLIICNEIKLASGISILNHIHKIRPLTYIPPLIIPGGGGPLIPDGPIGPARPIGIPGGIPITQIIF